MISSRVIQTAHAAGVAAGTIWGTGDNSTGELGLGEAVSLTGALALHQAEPIIERPTALAAGSHSLALDASGSVWAWGPNGNGQLGLGNALPPGASARHPYKVPKLRDVIAISAGFDHSLALDANGSVWAWGNNEKGQLGDGTTSNRSVPGVVKGLSEIVAIAAGLNFCLALGVDGQVWSWGANGHGQLGIGTTNDRLQPGTAPKLAGVMVISACGGGGEFSLALAADGKVWGWGFNHYGQLGDGTTTDRPSAKPLSIGDAVGVAAGAWHSVVLLADGAVKTAGGNDSGQLGDGTTAQRHKFDFVTVPEGDDPNPNIPLANVVEVASGGWHNFARIADGSVRAWGAGNAGRLGTGSESDHHQPVFVQEAPPGDDPSTAAASVTNISSIAAGAMHSLMIKTLVREAPIFNATSLPWAWGAGDYGQIVGNASASEMRYAVTFAPPLPISDLPGTAIAAERWHSLAAYFGELWVWGPTGSGSSFTDDPRLATFLMPTFPTDVVAIAAGGIGALALTSSGRLWSWSPFGLVAAQVPVVDDQGVGLNCTAIALGRQHGLVLTADGSVWCWGRNDRGQLGNGTVGPDWNSEPARVSMQNVVAVAAGAEHSLVLRADGRVWGWGANDKGQLGNNSTADAPAPVLAHRSDSQLVRAKAIAGGGEHSLALDAGGGVWAWGSNDYEQLGIAAVLDYATTARRVIWSADGPRPPALRSVKAIAAGEDHSLALFADGCVFGWGLNNAGQLGDGTDAPHGPSSTAPVSWVGPPEESGVEPILKLEGITAIAAGSYHSLALAGPPAVPEAGAPP